MLFLLIAVVKLEIYFTWVSEQVSDKTVPNGRTLRQSKAE